MVATVGREGGLKQCKPVVAVLGWPVQHYGFVGFQLLANSCAWAIWAVIHALGDKITFLDGIEGIL